MIEICEKGNCTGCVACINICNSSAIELVENITGFLYPQIIEEKCVECGSCKRICPATIDIEANNYMAVYAALLKNDEERLKSSSGGVFAALAEMVISNGGYVYGAAVCNDLVVRHIEINKLEELDKLRNSKYVQSEIGMCYKNAKQRLKDGNIVLFSGTPCQIAGLRSFLGKDYPSLLTVDLLCHGVPSPGLLRKYIESEEKIANSKIKKLSFRSKIVGWKKLYFVREFENGRKAEWGDTFIPGFLSNYYLRESCYTCQYATDKRQGDITLGDYWDYKESAPEFIEDDDKGISCVIINTNKGMNAFRSIRKKIAFAEKTIEDVKRGNPVLYKPCDKPDNYNEFWQDAENKSWDELKDKYFSPQDSTDWMSKELRDYYNIPFVKRHRKHKFKMYKKQFVRKIKRVLGVK